MNYVNRHGFPWRFLAVPTSPKSPLFGISQMGEVAERSEVGGGSRKFSTIIPLRQFAYPLSQQADSSPIPCGTGEPFGTFAIGFAYQKIASVWGLAMASGIGGWVEPYHQKAKTLKLCINKPDICKKPLTDRGKCAMFIGYKAVTKTCHGG